MAQRLSETESALKQFDTEIGQLRNDFETANGENAVLRKNLDQLRNEFEDEKATLERDLADAKTVKARFENACGALRGREQAHEDERKELRGVRDELEGKVRDLEATKKTVEKALASATGQLKRQTETLNGLQDTNKRLGDEATSLRQTLTLENARIKSDNKSLQNRVESLQDEVEKCEAKNTEHVGEKARLESDNKRLNKSVQEAKTKLSQHEATVSALNSSLLKAQAVNDSLQIDLTERQDLQQQLARELRTEKAKHAETAGELYQAQALGRKEQTETSSTIQDLEIKISGLESRANSLESNADVLQQGNTRLKLDISKYKGTQAGLERENTRLNKKCEDTNNKLSEAEDKASAIGSDLSAAEAKIETLRDALAKEKGQRTKLVKEMREECANHAKTTGDLDLLRSTSGSKIAELSKEIESSVSTIKGLEEETAKARSEADKARQKLDNIQSELSRQKRDLNEEKARVAKLNLELGKAFKRELEYDPERLYKQLDDERAAHAADVSRLEVLLSEEKANHAASISRLEADIAKRDADLRDHATRISDLETKLKAETVALDQEKSAAAALRRDIDSKASTITDLNNTIRNEQSVSQNLRNSLYTEQAAHGRTQNELFSATSTISDFEAKVAALKISGSHAECVEQKGDNGVERLMASYRRVWGWYAKKGGQGSHVNCYPVGLSRSTASGKQFILLEPQTL